jgi:group II intron reverse transcriptase/maturase
MQSGIERVAEKARSDTNLRFTSLAHHITEEQLLKELKSIPKSSAVGTDKMSVEDAIKEIPIWGKEVITQVHKRSYKPDSVRRVYIPKPGTQEKRPLGVPTVKDRCLQKATSRILEAIWEADFLDTSFGGRPGKSAHQAVLALRADIRNKPVNYVLEVDLRNFFGSLDHTWMMKFVEHRVGDPRILSLIKKWLKAGVVDGNELTYPGEGTPQGGSISVILSNIYMHYVLDIWFERVVRKYLKGHATCIRFIDDFVITFQYQDDAKKVLEVLPKRMEKFGLKIHPEKTRLLRFGSYAKVKWKQEGKRKETFTFLGFCFFMTKTKAGVTTVVSLR